MDQPATPSVRNHLANAHTVRAYDRELSCLRGLILDMGERVVEQTQAAVSALLDADLSPAYRVLDREPQIDFLALDADEEVFRVIARRQPTAVDLRIVLALARIAGEAERGADKAARIARSALEFRADDSDSALPAGIAHALRAQDELVCCAFERSIAAVSQFDCDLAVGIFEDEPALINATRTMHQALLAPLDPPLPPAKLGPLFIIAHALEYIGRHAGAIAEQVIYVAEGKDVRFRNREILIETLRHRGG
ncbi:phosphate signaling complex PhoU family protein [Candidatus Thiodictyon syntrophicum]|jgi:phosphate transport system protein|uniref:Phosphate transport system regulatory protein PhoU n=1 Tax=Candidatus Thiodictyon syntrophicum TaxID=1166950 RepID=A0A2K8U4L7_9GAMM|nr:PhoU domain-containing protein [Candidatus Thiodictyon syntrophicum]AUB80497.1 phosphate transport system regulatory protein PhoU [Candidatus Thiodictyon syntrophicum]